MQQADLFGAVLDTYFSADHPVNNADLYTAVADHLDLSEQARTATAPVGKAGQPRNLFHRRVRWAQQTLRQQRQLQRVGHGQWEMIGSQKRRLHAIRQGQLVLALSTRHGLCLWSKSETVFHDVIDEPVHLVLSSPPYPLKVQRAYGNVSTVEYVDFICRTLEPVVARMVEGASIALNVSNDIFEDRSPARSTYLERLIIALEDRLGLHKMDTLIFESNKLPGPTLWSQVHRYQLSTAFEPVLWFCNNPILCRADNRRVLQAHSDRHLALIRRGGLTCAGESGDGAHRKRPGDFGRETPGKIPRNILRFSNYCEENRRVNRYARRLRLPEHGAKMPYLLADFSGSISVRAR